MDNVQICSLPIGSYNGATEIPLLKVPDNFGGMTVVEANLLAGAGTAVGGKIVTMSDAGTPAINGTVGAFAGTVVTAAGVPAECTISTPYVAAGYWLGYDQTSGTVPAGAYIALSYLTGK